MFSNDNKLIVVIFYITLILFGNQNDLEVLFFFYLFVENFEIIITFLAIFLVFYYSFFFELNTFVIISFREPINKRAQV